MAARLFSLRTYIEQRTLFWMFLVWRRNLRHILRAVQYGVNANEGLGDEYNLRRFTHLLEKGICRTQFRPTFADAFIETAVDLWMRLSRNNGIDPSLLHWSSGVYGRYFGLAGNRSPAADRAQAKFVAAQRELRGASWLARPAKERSPCRISPEAFHGLAERRRSIREFLPKEVPLQEIRDAMATALLSPSACNRQAFRFHFSRDPATIAAIVNAAPGVKGLTFPAMVVVTVRYCGYFNEREILCPIIDSMQAVMAFQFALETRGLGSVCINWPADSSADKLLRGAIPLQQDEIAIMRLGVGYPHPEALVPLSIKRDTSLMLVINEERRNEPKLRN
jgi:nitroreductase